MGDNCHHKVKPEVLLALKSVQLQILPELGQLTLSESLVLEVV